MQRNEAPQSLSHKHCAVVGAASVHAPLLHAWPSAQSVVVAHAECHCPPTQMRPWPHAVSLLQRTTELVPQVLPPLL